MATTRLEPEPARQPEITTPARRRGVALRGLRAIGWLGLAGLAALLLAVAGYRWSRGELVRIEQELKAGRLDAARSRLARLKALGLGGVEPDYWLGVCAEAAGHVDAALAIYAAIPAGSSRYANAALRRAHLAREHGRYAEVEAALEPAQFPRTSLAFTMRERDLQHVYFFTGRSDDLRRRKHEEWALATNQAEVLRTHWQIDEPKAAPVRTIGARLEEVGRLAPQDDRVWLGKAYLAIRTARFAEADAWLKECRARRPEDPSVWRARLEWATTTDRPGEAVEAMRHLPADRLEPEQLLALRAWLAAHRGDDRAEQSALAQLLERVPGDTTALSRLTELAVRAGRAEQVAEFRRRKAQLDRVADAYRRILYNQVPTGHFDELGRLAEALGRWFEARGWWTLALRESAGGAEARAALSRLDRLEQARAPRDRSAGAAGLRTTAVNIAGGGSRLGNPGPGVRAPGNPLGAVPGGHRPQPPASDSGAPKVGVAGVAAGSAGQPPGEAGLEDVQRGSRRTVAEALADLIPAGLDDRAALSSLAVVPVFHDDAPTAGLHSVYDYDPTPLWRMPEMMGGGVGLLDYDGDGWLDVYAVQGGKLPNEPDPPPVVQGDRLFRNRGAGTFEDVTASAGLMAFPGGYGHGVAVGDYDNDGHPDLFLTRWRSYALYRNRGDGTFEDVTTSAGLGGRRDWPTSAAFADLDGDGDLDLYVCHYSAWDPQRSPPCADPNRPGRYVSCGPRDFAAMPDHVFRNDDGRFVDVSDRSGVAAADQEGRGLGVLAADLDEDGRFDLFVANDRTPNFLFRNRGGFRFEETAAESGVATNAEGVYLAGMGIACGDLDGDGRLDLAVTNFYGESTTFYRNLGAGQFVDHTAAVGLAVPSRYLLGFGTAFFDANNDGRLDLATANGHVNDLRPDVPFAMPAQLLLGEPSGRLVDVSRRAGAPWQVPRLGRGLAAGDLDNDGLLDLLIVAEGGPLAYFHNQGPAGHFLTVQLEGLAPRSNRDAVGARVTLTAGGRRQVAERLGGGSFLSAGDPRLHFGLGAAARVEAIEVHWPSGHVDRYTGLAADAAYRLREGRKEAGPLHGWRR